MIEDEHLMPLPVRAFLRIGTVDPTKATLANQIKALSNHNVEFFLIKPSDFAACMEVPEIKEAVVGKPEEKEAEQVAKAPARPAKKRSPMILTTPALW